MQRFLTALKRDAWLLALCIAALVFGIYNGRGVIVFFALAALIAWLFRRLSDKSGRSNW
ncbi:MAG: hypothetical protein V4583_14795 [Pseudomonadota bacterium]